MSNKICPLPWNHIAVQQNGDYRLCCQCVYPPFGRLEDNGNVLNIKDVSINDARNSLLHIKVRSEMLAGIESPECNLCWNDEKLNLISKRQHMLKEYDIQEIVDKKQFKIDTEIFPLRYLDIRFGNLCNLSCRTCGPGDSSLWYSDYIALNNKDTMQFYGSKIYEFKNINNVWTLKNDDFQFYEDKSVWDMLEKLCHHFDRLYLTGGEPFLNKAQWKLLEMCIEKGVAKNIVLEYNSNMTILPENAEKIWKNFKYVHLGCSIDTVGPLANYVRYPCDWKEVEHNLYKISSFKIDNINIKLAPTISVFNLLGFLEILEWLDTNRGKIRIRPTPSYHILQGPEYHNIKVLPWTTKNWILEKYEEWLEPYKRSHHNHTLKPILEFMMSEDKSNLLPKLKENTEILDKQRKQSMKDSIPWLYDVLQKY